MAGTMCADDPCCRPKLSGLKDAYTECWIRNIHDSVRGISSDGCHYVTPEICRELSHIDHGVAHIRLDHQLLDNKDWNKLCDQRRVAKHRQGRVTKTISLSLFFASYPRNNKVA